MLSLHRKKNTKNAKEALDAFLKVIELKATVKYEHNSNDWIKFYYLRYVNCDAVLPMNENIYYLLARTYFFNCKYKEAIEYYLKSIEIIETKSWYRANGYPDYYKHIEGYIGDAYMEMGQIKEAIEHFQTYTKNYRGPEVVKLAKVYCSNGQFKEAEETLLKTIEVQKKIGFVFTESKLRFSGGYTPYDLLIELYSTNKEYEKLIDLFLKDLHKIGYIKWMGLEDKYELEGLYEKTIDYINNMIEEKNEKLNNCSSVNVWRLLGVSSYKIGNIDATDATIDYFLKSVEEYHEDYFIWRLLGISYLAQEKFAEGLEALLTANALGDDNIVNKYWLGMAYMFTEQEEKGIKLLCEIAKLPESESFKSYDEIYLLYMGIDHSGARVWSIIGSVFMAGGNYEEAKKYLLKANELNPEDSEIKEELEQLENLLKE